jgi:hypothetical protein
VVDWFEERGLVVADLIFLLLTVLFFVVGIAYVSGCARLGGE